MATVSPHMASTVMGLSDWVSLAANACDVPITPREPLSRVREPEQYAQWIRIIVDNLRENEIVVTFNKTIVQLFALAQKQPNVFEQAESYCVCISRHNTRTVANWMWEERPQKMAILSWIGREVSTECGICYEESQDVAICFQCGKGVCGKCVAAVAQSTSCKCPFCRVSWVRYE